MRPPAQDECQTYEDLLDEFVIISSEPDSEEDDEWVTETGETITTSTLKEEVLVEGAAGSIHNTFLLSAAACATAATLDRSTASPHHTQPHFDSDTHSQLEAPLEAADLEVLCHLTSSDSCSLDVAAAALTHMVLETVGGAAAATVGDNSSTPGDRQRTLVEACMDRDVLTVRRLLDEGGSVHETTEEGDSLLALVCSLGYYEIAQVLLAMHANVDDRGINGDCSPLIEGVYAGHIEIVKLLIAHNTDVNAQSSLGSTALMYACARGHIDVVKVLLHHGANVEDHDMDGHTPLMLAALEGHVEIAKILLEKGAGINTHSSEFKESALILACNKGNSEMVKFLLGAGADQEHKTNEMHTALMKASMHGLVEVARLLLDSGAQVNMSAGSFESPLTLTACSGHTDLALLLLERGANIEEVNDEGYTPLMEAAGEGHEEMVTLLLAHGADINAQTEECQETALALACCEGFRDIADHLIKAGADLELGALTPLIEAAQEGHRDLVEYLIEAGANVNAQTPTRKTALTYACEKGHTDVADLLLQAGANMEHEIEGGCTPTTCWAGHLCILPFICVQGVKDDVTKTTTNDYTPLSLAYAGGHVSVVALLLCHGPDPHHKHKNNCTMVLEASRGDTKVVQLLVEFPTSISHLPIVVAPEPSVSGDSTGVVGVLTSVPLLEEEPPHLTMNFTVIPGLSPKTLYILNENQAIYDIFRQLDGLPGGSTTVSSTQASVTKVNCSKTNCNTSTMAPDLTPATGDKTSTMAPDLTPATGDKTSTMAPDLTPATGDKTSTMAPDLTPATGNKTSTMAPDLTPATGNKTSTMAPDLTPATGDKTSTMAPDLTPATGNKTSTSEAQTVGDEQLGVGGVLVSAEAPYMVGDETVPCNGSAGNGPTGVCPYPAGKFCPLVNVDIEIHANHDTPLTLACAGGHDELVQLLLARGADIEHRDKAGFTPLIAAAFAGRAKVVETLLTAGANIEARTNFTQETPLCIACSGGKYKVVEILLQRGANKDHRSAVDYTPLALAAANGSVDIIKLLLNNGTEIDSRTGSSLGISPLMLAAMIGHVAAVKLLLDMGSDINAQIKYNWNTALTLACFRGQHEVVSLLLDHKANVEHRSKAGVTPLMEAASGGFVEVGRVLLDNGADVNAPPVPSSLDTALTIAAEKGHYKFVELLIQR
nr:ankyrin repeat domain-containing protein 17-like [Procambarus clarkii]